MCPAYIATAVWIAGGAASGGGLTALIGRKLRVKNLVKKLHAQDKSAQNKSKENYDGYQHNRSAASQSRFAI
jgi:hypothetical protein